MKIGILGGSFDPIHNGHLHMAKCAYEAYALDAVWLIPAGHSPNKEEAKMTPAEDRFCMCELAAGAYEWLHVSRLELDSTERSYTYRTMEKLTAAYPMHTFYFIMGGDSLDYFERWKHPERIAQLAEILVIPRDSFTQEALAKKAHALQQQFACNISIVSCARYPMSSTAIRHALAEGTIPEQAFPKNVSDYIRMHHLYGQKEVGQNAWNEKKYEND